MPQLGQSIFQSSEPGIATIRPAFSPLEAHRCFWSSALWRILSSMCPMLRPLYVMDTTIRRASDNAVSLRGDKMVFVPSFPFRSARAEQAVPPGRVGYDLDADVLLLHTIQTKAAVEELMRNGVLRPGPEHIGSEWPSAYAWMNRMMAERLPTSGDAALWLWARLRREDLISNCRRTRGQVLLTCRIPRERVLLSQFDEWHAALNSFVAVPPRPGESNEDYDTRYTVIADAFLARLSAAGARRAPIEEWPTELREEAERSWECIFVREHYGRRSYWQATVHELRASDVVDAVRIV